MAFYKCGNLHLQDAKGKPLMVLKGVNRPEVFRETLLKSRESRTQVEASLATIQAPRLSDPALAARRGI